MWWSQRIMDQVESYPEWRRQYFLNPQFLTEKLLAFLLAHWQAPPHCPASPMWESALVRGTDWVLVDAILSLSSSHHLPGQGQLSGLLPGGHWGPAQPLAMISVCTALHDLGWARPSLKKRWHLQFHAQSSFSWVPTLSRVLGGYRMNKTRLPTWREPQSRSGDNTCR